MFYVPNPTGPSITWTICASVRRWDERGKHGFFFNCFLLLLMFSNGINDTYRVELVDLQPNVDPSNKFEALFFLPKKGISLVIEEHVNWHMSRLVHGTPINNTGHNPLRQVPDRMCVHVCFHLLNTPQKFRIVVTFGCQKNSQNKYHGTSFATRIFVDGTFLSTGNGTTPL